jgi:hypothetical protein
LLTGCDIVDLSTPLDEGCGLFIEAPTPTGMKVTKPGKISVSRTARATKALKRLRGNTKNSFGMNDGLSG